MCAIPALLALVLTHAVPATADVSPVRENVIDNCDGTYTAVFGYENLNDTTVVVPVGGQNYFSGADSAYQGQPTTFLVGRYTNVFTVHFAAGQELVWNLTGRSSTAAAGDAGNSCGLSPVTPLLERVVDSCNGAYAAVFGYDNPNDESVTIEIGPRNRFGDVDDRGQPTVFAPGRAVEVFTVPFDGGTLTWSLDEREASASAALADNRCGSLPVTPTVLRVEDNCDSTYTAVFGYTNPNGVSVTIPIGIDNILEGFALQPQPEVFAPDTVDSAFALSFAGDMVSWRLENDTAHASVADAVNGCGTSAVRPVLEYVAHNCNGTYTAHFGYMNENADTTLVPIGDENMFTGLSGADQGQPILFAPGRQVAVFTVDFAVEAVVWTLRGRTSAAGRDAAQGSCGGEPVVPRVDTVIDNCDSTYTAWFGYENLNADTVFIGIGSANSFTGTGTQPQVAVFAPGVHHSVFAVDFHGLPVTWTIDYNGRYAATATADQAVPCICGPIELLQPPVPVTAVPGQSVTFSVAVADTNVTYQWKRNDEDIFGAEGAVISFGPVAEHNNNDEFRVVIQNRCERTLLSDIALLTVEPRGVCSVVQPPLPDTVEAGYPFVAWVSVSCPDARYRWLRDGATVEGAEDSVLVTAPMALSDTGTTFRCVVSNGVAADTSEPARVWVIPGRSSSRRIAISGELTGADGMPVGATDTVLVHFVVKLYPAAAGGTPVYTEDFSAWRAVPVHEGRFTLELGGGVADGDLQAVVASHDNLFAELWATRRAHPARVGARVPLSAAPYAFSAGVRVSYGGGSPVAEGIDAPVGAVYVDTDDGNATWKKAATGWVKLD